MVTLIKSKIDNIDVLVESAPRERLESLLPDNDSEQELTPERVAQLEQAIQVAGGIAKKMQDEVVRPQGPELSRVAVTLNLGFSAEGSIALFAKATGSASFEISLEWTRPPVPRDPTPQ